MRLRFAPEHTAPSQVPAIAGACLRIYDSNGSETSRMCIAGVPSFMDVARNGAGVRYAGICLVTVRDGEVGAVMLDSRNAGWWDELIAAAMQARDSLVYGGFRDLQPAGAGSAVTG
jgi:hypothetical protein